VTRQTTIVLITLLALSAVSAPAAAQQDEWQISLIPYGWISGMSGTFGALGAVAEVDVSFGDIVENLEVGVLVHVEAQKQRWSVLFDAIFLAVGEGIPEPPGAVDVDQVIAEVSVGFEVADGVDLLAGGRWVSIDTTVQVGFDPGDIYKDDQGWVDPLVGARVRRDLNDRWLVHLRGDIGGFGAGSDFTWNLEADASVRVTERLSLIFGYRVLDIDYDEGVDLQRFLFDAGISGPRFGMALSF